jgi:hypothetical protein
MTPEAIHHFSGKYKHKFSTAPLLEQQRIEDE